MNYFIKVQFQIRVAQGNPTERTNDPNQLIGNSVSPCFKIFVCSIRSKYRPYAIGSDCNIKSRVQPNNKKDSCEILNPDIPGMQILIGFNLNTVKKINVFAVRSLVMFGEHHFSKKTNSMNSEQGEQCEQRTGALQTMFTSKNRFKTNKLKRLFFHPAKMK